jgi:hypothetical protein
MLRRRRSGHLITSSAFLLAGLVALVVVAVMFVPATEGKAQQPRGTGNGALTPTNSPATSATVTATPTVTALPTAECEAAWKLVPAPDLGDFADIAAISSDDVWVVGDTGAIHWDGASWSSVPTAGITDFYSVSAVSQDDVWAINSAHVIHWDGTSWSLAFDPPASPGNGGAYFDVKAIASDDVWVVGSHWPTIFRPASYAIHWDGEEWTVTNSPEAGSSGSQMYAVSGIAGGHVWAVGRDEGPKLFRWTGTAWETVAPGGDPYSPWELLAVEVVAPDDVWAGGYQINGASSLQHYNGSEWAGLSSVGFDIGAVAAISAVAPDDVWAGGDQGIIHWDGSTWSQVPAPAGYFRAIDAIGPEDAWAVGKVSSLVVVHYSNDPFWDVRPGSPFYSYIRCLACRGIVSGYSDSSFRPNERVTRGQAAKIISNAAGYNDDIPGGRRSFADAMQGNPFWVYIERVYAHGAISGYPCGGEGEPCSSPPRPYYRPGAYLTRGQLAKITSNVAGYDDTSSGQSFNDVPPGSPFYTYVERAAAHDVISGYPCGGTNPDTGEAEPCPGAYFRPGSNVSRGQTAKIVANSLLPGCEVPTRR